MSRSEGIPASTLMYIPFDFDRRDTAYAIKKRVCNVEAALFMWS